MSIKVIFLLVTRVSLRLSLRLQYSFRRAVKEEPERGSILDARRELPPVVFSKLQERFRGAVARSFLDCVKVFVEQKVRENKGLDRDAGAIRDTLQGPQRNRSLARFNAR